MKKILVCPVAFNEHVKLKNVIERFLKCNMRASADFLVVDDASTDETTAIIQSFVNQGVLTIKHAKRSGTGAAIRTAVRFAQEKSYEVLVIIAGNDKDNPDEIPRLVDPILREGFDFVQGSRYLGVKKRTGGDMPLYRKIATRLHPILMSLITKRNVTDSTNCFRAFRLSFLENDNINIDQLWLDKYELEPYLYYKALVLGYRTKRGSGNKDISSQEIRIYKDETHYRMVEHLKTPRLSRFGNKKIANPYHDLLGSTSDFYYSCIISWNILVQVNADLEDGIK